MTESVQIAEHIIHENLAVVRCDILLQDVRHVDADFPQTCICIVQILRRHEVMMIHIVKRLLRLIVRVDANDGDNKNCCQEEYG